MGKGEFTLMSEGKIEARRSAAHELVDAIKAIIAHMPSDDMPIEAILRESADAMNSANRALMGDEDIGYAIAAIVYHQCDMDSLYSDAGAQAALEACKAFGLYFASLMNGRAEEFAPHAKQWELLRQTILFLLDTDQQLTVTQLARKTKVHPSGIRAEINRGNLPATKLGKTWAIDAEDAAVWLANPKRGSRKG
jgi:hypothetical protein